MQIHRGSNRVAVVIGTVVFKFPHINDLWLFIPKDWKSFRRKGWQGFKKGLYQGLFRVLRGVIANVTEYACWVTTQSPYLAPVYFSLGIVTIQRYVPGEKPTYPELIALWNQLPERAQRLMLMMDPHGTDRHNFRKNADGIWMIDYGDNWADGCYPLTSFLTEWHESLDRVFRPHTLQKGE